MKKRLHWWVIRCFLGKHFKHSLQWKKSQPEEMKSKASWQCWMFSILQLILGKKPPYCPLCNSSHDLDECRNLNKIEVEGRSKFLSKQKLYYGCYEKIFQSHIAHNCPIRRTCKICVGKHPTGLHGFMLKRKGDNSAGNDVRHQTSEIIKSNCSNISNTQCEATGSGQVLSMCVVPVKVQHKKSNK